MSDTQDIQSSPIAEETVWISESPGQCCSIEFDYVATSIDALVRAAKAPFPSPPYIVRWDELEQVDDDHYELCGHFENVPGHSIRHDAVYYFRRVSLVS